MCFAVTEKATNSIASWLIMSKQSESFAPTITSSLWFLPALFSESLPTFFIWSKIFFRALKCRRYKCLIFFLFPALLFNLLKFPTTSLVEIAKPNSNTSTPKSQADTLNGEFLLDLSDISIWGRALRKHLRRGGPVIGRTLCPSHSNQTHLAFLLPVDRVGNSTRLLIGARATLNTRHTSMTSGNAVQRLINLLTKPVRVEKCLLCHFCFSYNEEMLSNSAEFTLCSPLFTSLRKLPAFVTTKPPAGAPVSFLSKEAFRPCNALFGCKQVRCKVF